MANENGVRKKEHIANHITGALNERICAARTIIQDKYIRYRKYLTKGKTEKELER